MSIKDEKVMVVGVISLGSAVVLRVSGVARVGMGL